MIFKDLGFCRSFIKSASLIFVLIASAPLCLAQAGEFAAFLPESLIREWAIEKVMPAYPEEALKAGISGVVKLKLEISADGEVLRIKAVSICNDGSSLAEKNKIGFKRGSIHHHKHITGIAR